MALSDEEMRNRLNQFPTPKRKAPKEAPQPAPAPQNPSFLDALGNVATGFNNEVVQPVVNMAGQVADAASAAGNYISNAVQSNGAGNNNLPTYELPEQIVEGERPGGFWDKIQNAWANYWDNRTGIPDYYQSAERREAGPAMAAFLNGVKNAGMMFSGARSAEAWGDYLTHKTDNPYLQNVGQALYRYGKGMENNAPDYYTPADYKPDWLDNLADAVIGQTPLTLAQVAGTGALAAATRIQNLGRH